MSLQQQNTVHWSRFTDEAVKMLETSDDVAPTDKILCHMAKLQRIYDQAIGLFFQEGSAAEISRTLVDLERQTQHHGPGIEASHSCTPHSVLSLQSPTNKAQTRLN